MFQSKYIYRKSNVSKFSVSMEEQQKVYVDSFRLLMIFDNGAT